MAIENFKMESDENFEKVKDRALRLLARRDHSVKELKTKLRLRSVPADVIDEVMSYLGEMGYLVKEDDLAGRWVKQWRSEGRGRHWINGKLKTKGLPVPHLSDDEEELEAARYFASKKLRSKSPKTLSLSEKARLSRSMISRGFSSSVVATILKE